MSKDVSHWQVVWRQFCRRPLGVLAFLVLLVFAFVGLYVPLLVSSKPLFVIYDGRWYFPLARYLFFRGFFTKPVDLFFNVAMFSVPLGICALVFLRGRWRSRSLWGICVLHLSLFFFLIFSAPHDPASDRALQAVRESKLAAQSSLGQPVLHDWSFDLRHLSPYGRLNLVLRHLLRKRHHERMRKAYGSHIDGITLSTLWELDQRNLLEKRARLEEHLRRLSPEDPLNVRVASKLQLLEDRERWLAEEAEKVTFVLMPLLRPFHWEDDAGGARALNQHLKWWDLTRLNRKDLVASLLFGIRVSLCVGLSAVALSLLFAVPLGLWSGYYGGRVDIVLCRFVEVWEAMPVFFMLLMIVAILQSKSIFLVIAVLGIFGWTGFVRYLRGEVLRQRSFPYVEACRSLGFSSWRIMFSHILPNAIPPLLTLLPFSLMAAITSEAGLSFLGLGEEGSASWGVLMDEGRSAFPAESYLLWPPAIMLTILLVAIAIVGDVLRDALDPKMRR